MSGLKLGKGTRLKNTIGDLQRELTEVRAELRRGKDRATELYRELVQES